MRRTLVTTGILLGIFLAALDSTVVGTAMPTVIASLGGTALYSWVFASYMLTLTTATPIFGKLCDLFGQKLPFALSVGLFLLGSALSGSAQTMPQLIVFRALQGIGGGGILAVAFTIIGHIFAPTERPKVQGLLGMVWAFSSIVGPTTGGFIVDHFSWRWTFFINMPIGVVPVILVLANLQDSRQRNEKPTIDFVGAICLAASLVSLLLALLQGSTDGWTSTYILGLFVASIVLLLIFIWNESRTPEPIVPLSLFRLRTFSLCNLDNLLAGAALFGILGFIPLFVQGVLGGSATSAGIALMPLNLGWPLGSLIAGQLVNRTGYRNMGIVGMALLAAGFYMLQGMGVDSDPLTVGRNMFVVGLGMGSLTPTLNVAVQNAVPRTHMGVASASVVFYRNIGGTVGVSVMGAIINSQMVVWVSQLVDSSLAKSLSATVGTSLSDPQVLLKPELTGQLPPGVASALEQSLANSLHSVFIVSMFISLIGLIVATFMLNSTPAKDMERMAQAGADSSLRAG